MTKIPSSQTPPSPVKPLPLPSVTSSPQSKEEPKQVLPTYWDYDEVGAPDYTAIDAAKAEEAEVKNALEHLAKISSVICAAAGIPSAAVVEGAKLITTGDVEELGDFDAVIAIRAEIMTSAGLVVVRHKATLAAAFDPALLPTAPEEFNTQVVQGFLRPVTGKFQKLVQEAMDKQQNKGLDDRPSHEIIKPASARADSRPLSLRG